MLLPDPVCLPRDQADLVISGFDIAQELLAETPFLVGLLRVEEAVSLLVDTMFPEGPDDA